MKNTNLVFGIFLFLAIISTSAQNSFQVEKSGKGQPILLLPGFACTHEVFDGFKDELADDYELHAFTFAGFGGVPPIEFPWLPQIKKEIETYVKINNLKAPIIIGHSLGGTLGLWLSSDSEMFSQLIVIDALPAMGALMIPDYDSEAIDYDNPHSLQILNMEEEAFREMAIQSAGFMTSKSDNQQILADWIFTSDRKTYAYGYTDLLKLDLREALSKITIPVHILAATLPYGTETAESNYRKQYAKLQEYSLNFAEESGHFIMYEQPEWLSNQIHTALKSNE